MGRLALQGSVRRVLVRLHRWSGLVVLALLAVAAATGTVLVFRAPLDRSVNRDVRVVAERNVRLPTRQIIEAIEARYPGSRAGTITLPAAADDALIAYLSQQPASSATPRVRISDVFVDPYSGRILGHRVTGNVFARAYVIPLIARLHASLFAGRFGGSLMGGVAVIWLLTSILGVALVWPSRWRRGSSWSDATRVRMRRGGHVAAYDLHRSVGILLLPIWLVLAATSIYLAFPSLVRSVVMAMLPLEAEPIPASTWEGGAIADPDVAIARALAALPRGRAFGITRDFANHRYSVRLSTPSDVNPAGNTQVYVDFATGDVLATRLASDATPGQRLLNWQFPLHSGEAFGAAGQAAFATAGVALFAMELTGFYLWLRGWTARRTRTRTLEETTR